MPHDSGLACSVGPNIKQLNHCSHGFQRVTGSPEPRNPDSIVMGTRVSMVCAAVEVLHQQRRNESTTLQECTNTCQTLRKKECPDGAGHVSWPGRAGTGRGDKAEPDTNVVVLVTLAYSLRAFALA